MTATRRRAARPAESSPQPETLEGALNALEASEREKADRMREELAAPQELVRLMAGGAEPQAVLEAVTLLTARLIGTGRATVYLLVDDSLHMKTSILQRADGLWLMSADAGVVRRRPVGAAPGEWREVEPVAALPPPAAGELLGQPLDPGWVAGRAILERRTVVVSEFLGPQGDDFPVSRDMVTRARARGAGGHLAVATTPLLRGGQPLGVLSARSTTAHEFTPAEITLLETFAAQ